MKKILIVSYYFPPYGGGGVIRIHNYVKYLPKFGFKPIVLTVNEDYYEKIYEVPELLNEYGNDIQINRTASLEPKSNSMKQKVYGVKKKNVIDRFLLWILKNTFNKLLIPDRSILWAPYALMAGRRIIKIEKIDLILSNAPPFSAHIIAYLLHKITKKPFVMDYRDDWIGNVFYQSGNFLRNQFEKRIEAVLVKEASMVVTTTKKSMLLFQDRYPHVSLEKYIHISNGYDPSYFNAGEVNLKENPAKKTINFTYTGSLTVQRTPEYFLLAVKELLKENDKLKDVIKISFIGFIHNQHKKLIKSLDMESFIDIKENISPKMVAYYLQNKADVCLVFQRQGEGGETAIPGKLYEYLASKKPIFCMDEGGVTTEYLQGIGSRLNVDYKNVQKIKAKLEYIIKSYSVIKKLYEWDNEFLSNFNRERQTEVLSNVFKGIVK